MPTRIYTRPIYVLLLALTVAPAPSVAQTPCTSAESLRVTTVTFGTFVPIEEFEERRLELLEEAFRAGRVRVIEESANGAVEVEPTIADLEALLASATPRSRSIDALLPASVDYDGDGFIGADDQPPLRYGEYVADVPRINLDFDAQIEPGIVVERVSTGETEEFTKTLTKTSYENNYQASASQSFKTSFKFSLIGLFAKAADAAVRKFSFDPKLDAGLEYNRSREWSQATKRELQESMEHYFQEKRNDQIRVGAEAGFLRSSLLITNTSHFPADMAITNLRTVAKAYSPRSAAEFAWGQVSVEGTICLYSGSGNNTALRFLAFPSINTVQMEQALLEGRTFYFDISGDYLARSIDGTIDWRARMSQALSQTAWITVNYGDQTREVFRMAAIQARDGGDLTVQKALEEVFGAAHVSFGVHAPSGRAVVTRVQHRENRHADRDFDTLTPPEQAEYGRWAVVYAFGNNNLANDLFIDTTPLRQGDVVSLFYLTAEDLIPDAPEPDLTITFDLPAQGAIGDGGLLAVAGPVHPGDEVELAASNHFTIYRQSQTHHQIVDTWNCGILINATCYGRQLEADDSLFVPIPNVDWYGVKVSFGTTNPRTWLFPSQLGAQVVRRSDFPEYEFTIRFTVTEALLNGQSQGEVRIAQDMAAPTLLRDCRGWDISGTSYYDCTSTWDKELRSAQGALDWLMYTPDSDADGFTALQHFGLDWNDFDLTVYPGAPELWDGKDNDQDSRIEGVTVVGPSRLPPGESGVFVGTPTAWTGAAPTYSWWRREFNGGNTTPWVLLGTGPSVTQTMTGAGPAPDNAADSRQQRAPQTGFDLRVRAQLAGNDYTAERIHQVVRGTSDPDPCFPICIE